MEPSSCKEEKTNPHNNKSSFSEMQTFDDLSAKEQKLLLKFRGDSSFRKALCSLLKEQEQSAEMEAENFKK